MFLGLEAAISGLRQLGQIMLSLGASAAVPLRLPPNPWYRAPTLLPNQR